jgi:sugar lactone lactonase YvrE
LVGIPGAAYAGPPILNEVDDAWVSPAGKWAVVATDGHSALVPLSGSNSRQPSGAGLIDAADRVVWSHDGCTALLYSSNSKLLQLVRVCAEAAAGEPIDLSPWGAAATLAIDAGGRRIAFGVAGAGLYGFDAGQSPALLSNMALPVAAAFDDSGRLYAVDGATQQLLQFDTGASGFTFASLAESADSPALDVSGLAVSAGGRYVMVADRGNRTIRVYDTASHALSATLPLDFAPTRMDAISTSPVFLLNGDNENEWLLLLDARNIPATYFVPASTEDRQ